MVWIYGHQVTKTSYAFYVLVIAIIDLLFTVVVVPFTLFLRVSEYVPFGNMNVQELLYYSPKDFCQVFTVFLLIFIAEVNTSSLYNRMQNRTMMCMFQERIKIFSNPFRPITKAKYGLIRIACVFLLALLLFAPPLVLVYYGRTFYVKLFTKALQPLVIIIGTSMSRPTHNFAT